eukprot:SAG11_NODE_1081_length_5956_cov_14.482506_1_plen_81_part_00
MYPKLVEAIASDEQFSNLKPTPLPPNCNEIEEGMFELEKILDHDVSGRRHLAKGGAKNIDITHPAHVKQNICARRNYRYR